MKLNDIELTILICCIFSIGALVITSVIKNYAQFAYLTKEQDFWYVIYTMLGMILIFLSGALTNGFKDETKNNKRRKKRS
jgi:membrane protease YdiL (CAAX protease family)